LAHRLFQRRQDLCAFVRGAGGVDQRYAELECGFTRSARGYDDGEADDARVYLPFVDGIALFAGAFQFGLQLAERGSFGEGDELAWVQYSSATRAGAAASRSPASAR